MKQTKTIGFLFFLFSYNFFSLAWAFDFQEIEGCYETLLIDHQIPYYGNRYEKTLTTIEHGISSSFTSITHQSLEHLVINLYTGSSGMWDSYHPFVLFPELGSAVFEDQSITYSMKEDLFFWQNYRPQKVDHSTSLSLKRINEDEVSGIVKFDSQVRGIKGYRQFRLKKVLCI